MPDAIRIVINKRDGRASFIYSDEAAALTDGLGDRQITRASEVEPDDAGGWSADMARSNGPVLGPFPTKAEALAAEAAWITEHVLRCPRPAAPAPSTGPTGSLPASS